MAQTRKSSSGKKRKSSKKSKSTVTISKNSLVVIIAVLVGIFTAMLLFNTALVSGGKIGGSSKPDTNVVKVEKTQQTSSSKKQNKTASNKSSSNKVSSNKEPSNKKTSSSSSSASSTNASTSTTTAKSVSSASVASVSAPDTSAVSPAPASVSSSTSDPSSTSTTTKNKPLDSIPYAKNGAKIAIIYDDGGQNMAQLEKCLAVPFPVTVAVLPRLVHSKEASVRVRATGNEVMLHQPMQAVNLNVNPGQGAITPEMTEDDIRSVLFQNLNEVGPVAGINNHEGSKITANAEQMCYVLKVCSDYGVFFLDSRTNKDTAVPAVASALGYSYYERNIFLDNQKTRENIISEVLKGLAIANKNGSVIMIGHVWSADILPAVLTELYPLLKQKGYTFTTVSKSGAMITPY
ncbi:MAG: divergent polysaccharide deacetylase family protein [Treponema sp.]|nr:divergent polysaccharide deacetylase family protein [Treponema sp.]